MAWQILFDPEFELWFAAQAELLQDDISATLLLLAEFGPRLGRPQVDSLKGSRLGHLKELRVQHKGKPWRILFAFDPKRRSILLVGGNKAGDKRWYDKHIPIAEARYQRHLQSME